MDKITTLEMEIALARFINPRVNLVVPNVSWGFFNHECDLISISKSGFATEYEIKVSKSDLKADKKKKHTHDDNKIKALYFAIPYYMMDCIDDIPQNAGIVVITKNENGAYGCTIKRDAIENKAPYRFTESDKYQIARLGALRIFPLKEKCVKQKKDIDKIKEELTTLKAILSELSDASKDEILRLESILKQNNIEYLY